MISIIIPVFNNYTTLPKCLAGVFKQTYKDIEVIVVDDGSENPDRILQITKEYPQVKYIRQKNQGAPAARNRGFAESKGQFLLFLDADIVLKKDALAEMLAALKKSSAAFCYSAFRLGWKKFALVEFDLEKLKKTNYIHTSSLIKREVFPGFDESLKKFQDWDLWLTLVEKGYFGVGINKVLFKIIDTHGTMSVWLPKFIYKLPWPLFGFTPKALKSYQQAEKIIKQKHNL